MLYTTVELIAQVSSNFHLVFCFCNAIILVLLIGNSKFSHRSDVERRCLNHTSSPIDSKVSNKFLVKDEDDNNQQSNNFEEMSSSEVDNNQVNKNIEKKPSFKDDIVKVEESEYSAGHVALIKENSDATVNFDHVEKKEQEQGKEVVGIFIVDENNYKNGDDAEDDDELRRKIEEFINKVNNTWRAEKVEDITSYE